MQNKNLEHQENFLLMNLEYQGKGLRFQHLFRTTLALYAGVFTA